VTEHATRPIWISGDWHLSPRSPPAHARLARAFLARAEREGARVVLNGDVFDDLFAGAGRPALAHPDVAGAIEALARAGRLERTRGNHDPDAGSERVELAAPGVGRIVVAHGHALDPVNASPVGRLGDAISRRFGRLAVVRGAAWLVEATARAVAEERMVALFRRRCLELVEREGFDLGVFGHVHVAHLAPGDRYANAGALGMEALSYLVVDLAGPRLCALRVEDLGREETKPGAMG
jgi:UDP-2,3-diacylglucosamine pyrophosphatase LpxH